MIQFDEHIFQIGLKPPTRMGWNIKLVEGIHTYTFLLVYIPTGGNDPIYFPQKLFSENLKANDLHEPNLHGVHGFHPVVFGIVPLLVNSFKFMRCLYWPYKQQFLRGILLACVVFVVFFIDFRLEWWEKKTLGLQAPGELSDLCGSIGKPTWMRKWEDEEVEVEGAPDPSILLAF